MKRQYDKHRCKKNVIRLSDRLSFSDKTLVRMLLFHYKAREASLLIYSYEYWTIILIRERLHHLKEWADLTSINMDPSKLLPVPVAALSKA